MFINRAYYKIIENLYKLANDFYFKPDINN